MTNKQLSLINELTEYLPFDKELSQKDKDNLLALETNFESEWAKIVYDYFFSHIDDNGSPISLNQFLMQDNSNSSRYKKADEIFIEKLFKAQKPIFFFDVDNTLTHWGHLSQEKIDFIKSYPEKHRIILTTGKTYDSIKPVIDACGLEENYASCINGSVLVEKGEFTTLEQIGSISEEIVKHFENAPFNTVVYYPDNMRALKDITQKNKDLLKTYTETYFIEKEIDYSKVVKVLFFIYDGESEKEQLVKDYVKDFPNLVCMRTAGHTYEILKKNQHKGNTVKIISKLMGNYYRATIGVGDSMNDSQLLSHVGKPFVVDTASDDLKSFGYEVLEKNRDIDIVNLIKKYTKEN